MDRTVKQANMPAAFKLRGNRIARGMVVAVPCAAADDEYMGRQPFWLARVMRLTKHRISLWYFGDQFLGLYTPLMNQDKSRHIYTWRHEENTILHWNIKLTGMDSKGRGRLSAGDQKVLSLDVRVAWQKGLEESDTDASAAPAAAAASVPPAMQGGRGSGRRRGGGRGGHGRGHPGRGEASSRSKIIVAKRKAKVVSSLSSESEELSSSSSESEATDVPLSAQTRSKKKHRTTSA